MLDFELYNAKVLVVSKVEFRIIFELSNGKNKNFTFRVSEP